jgi:hypothetical protein
MDLNVNAYAGHSAALDALSDTIKASLTELIFTVRDGLLTCCVVTDNVDDFRAILGGTVPNLLSLAPTARYAVDLESIGTDKVRLYIDSPYEDQILIGYYFTSVDEEANPYEFKVYKKVPTDKNTVLVDRFNPVGDLISSGEPEKSVDVSQWKGPVAILNTAKSQGRTIVCLKKTMKNQSYLRIIN